MSLCYCRWVLYFSVLGVVVRVEWGGGRFRRYEGYLDAIGHAYISHPNGTPKINAMLALSGRPRRLCSNLCLLIVASSSSSVSSLMYLPTLLLVSAGVR